MRAWFKRLFLKWSGHTCVGDWKAGYEAFLADPDWKELLDAQFDKNGNLLPYSRKLIPEKYNVNQWIKNYHVRVAEIRNAKAEAAETLIEEIKKKMNDDKGSR